MFRTYCSCALFFLQIFHGVQSTEQLQSRYCEVSKCSNLCQSTVGLVYCFQIQIGVPMNTYPIHTAHAV